MRRDDCNHEAAPCAHTNRLFFRVRTLTERVRPHVRARGSIARPPIRLARFRAAHALHRARPMRSFVVLSMFAVAACDAAALPQFGPGTGLRGFGAEDAGSAPTPLLYGTLADAGHEAAPPSAQPEVDASTAPPPPSSTSDSDPPPPSDPPPSADLSLCAIGPAGVASISYTKAMGAAASLDASWATYDAAGNTLETGTCPAPSIDDDATLGYATCNAFVLGASRVVFSFHGTNLLSLTTAIPSTC